ncbi:MAG: hypothetical protein QG552_3439, partial [Thermodesulfobacteriota bacterium]|nr:hypothetical protein [Thermodesulfobacteriota bacterium]
MLEMSTKTGIGEGSSDIENLVNPMLGNGVCGNRLAVGHAARLDDPPAGHGENLLKERLPADIPAGPVLGSRLRMSHLRRSLAMSAGCFPGSQSNARPQVSVRSASRSSCLPFSFHVTYIGPESRPVIKWRREMVAYKRSVCPHDCPDTCGLLVGVEDGRVVSVKGDPDHPFTRGAVCVKVKHYGERVHSPLRIHHPLKRVGEKGEGAFAPISWDQALCEIVDRYQRIISEFGAEAILPYSYAGTMGLIQFHAGHAFFHRLGASRLLRTICGAAAEAGFSASMGRIPTTDIESAVDADLILLWGTNTLSTNMHAWPFFLKA